MAAIKNYTDISQSKTLSKILPLESADYCWGLDVETLHYNSSPYPCAWKDYTCKEYYIPCWSLASLLGVLPNPSLHQTKDGKWYCTAEPNRLYFSGQYNKPIDACVAMIEKLHGLKML